MGRSELTGGLGCLKRCAKTVLVCIILMIPCGCIMLCDIGESFSAVPYGGMYTTSYWTERKEVDGVECVFKHESRFPIGFFGNLNVKFWNAYGDYRDTCTYRRYQEWMKLPRSERTVKTYRLVDGNRWVEVEKDGKKEKRKKDEGL